jgi:hypothetical protein
VKLGLEEMAEHLCGGGRRQQRWAGEEHNARWVCGSSGAGMAV